MPPNEVWGFEVGDRVEFRKRVAWSGVPTEWHLANVAALTKDRSVIVVSDERVIDGHRHEVTYPNDIRLWKPPSTTDDIEAFLNGR